MLQLVDKIRIGIKTVQLVLACICIGMMCSLPLALNFLLLTIEVTTFNSFIIILPGILFGYCVNERVPRRLDMLWTVVGAVLFLTAGIIRLNNSHHVGDWKRESEALGSLAIINSVLFIVDGGAWFNEASGEYTPH